VETARISVRVLARLILSEIAQELGKSEEDVLEELIKQAAIVQLGVKPEAATCNK